MDETLKNWIDNASYTELLRRWRHAPSGDPIFQGEIGQYYAKVMREKRDKCDHVAASKQVGW